MDAIKTPLGPTAFYFNGSLTFVRAAAIRSDCLWRSTGKGGATMKMIPKFYHGVLDYISGLLLLAAPNLLGFAEIGGVTAWLPRIVGVMILLQGLMTDYELGLMKVIPIAIHLM